MMRLRIATTALVLSGALLAGAPVASASSPARTTAVAVVHQAPAAAPEAGSSVTQADVTTVSEGRKSKKKKKKKKGFGSGLVIGLILGIALLVVVALLLARRKRSSD
ncbi:hypothetical protein AB0F96_05980 [Streptomyces sp. NPDC023998]|uniref:hypothetical protein n=1 Tax=Streptomyces sp. NPDC023998 TaxID=3154597 RepID=UPI0033E4AA8D